MDLFAVIWKDCYEICFYVTDEDGKATYCFDLPKEPSDKSFNLIKRLLVKDFLTPYESEKGYDVWLTIPRNGKIKKYIKSYDISNVANPNELSVHDHMKLMKDSLKSDTKKVFYSEVK